MFKPWIQWEAPPPHNHTVDNNITNSLFGAANRLPFISHWPLLRLNRTNPLSQIAESK